MRWSYALLVVSGCAFDPQDQAPGIGSDAAPAIDTAVPLIDAAPAVCPARYEVHFGNHSYFGTSPTNRPNAQSVCAEDGGHLIKIETEDEALELADRVDIFPTSFVWIGLADHADGAGYVWEDGAAPQFARWNGTEPGQASPDCVIANTVDGNGHWQANDCTATLIGVCECDAN
ncbi:MAG: C-type lectin domain-containing protein [Kofleriaceae bacterium]